jgi:hypothetical protein
MARKSATHDWTSVRVSHDFPASQKGWKTRTLSTGSLVTGRGPIDAFEFEPILQSHGIPASKAATSEDMSYDPQLAWRKHFVDVEDSKLGKVVVERSSYIPSDTPGKIARSALRWVTTRVMFSKISLVIAGHESRNSKPAQFCNKLLSHPGAATNRLLSAH